MWVKPGWTSTSWAARTPRRSSGVRSSCSSSTGPARAGSGAAGAVHLVALGMAHPGGVHVGVAPTERHELIVGAALHDAAFVHHHDAVRLHGGCQAVGDEDGGAALQQHVEGG